MGIAIIVPEVRFTDANLGQVTLKNKQVLKSLTIKEDSVAGTTTQLTVKYEPIVTDETGVTWSIVSGDQYATIDEVTGNLSISTSANNSVVEVKAISTVRPEISTIKSIYVTYVPKVYDSVTAFCKRVLQDGGTLIYGDEAGTQHAYNEHTSLLGTEPKLDFLAYKGNESAPTKLYSLDSIFDSNNVTGIAISGNKLSITDKGAVFFSLNDYSETEHALTSLYYDGNVVNKTDASSCFVQGLIAAATDAGQASKGPAWSNIFYLSGALNFQQTFDSLGKKGIGFNYPTQTLNKLFVKVRKVSKADVAQYIESCKVNSSNVQLTPGTTDYWGYSGIADSNGFVRSARIVMYQGFNIVLGA